MYSLFLPYLSAATPNGMLAPKADMPITVTISPIMGIDKPCIEVKKKERSV
jgi:hypothetical protein